MISEDLPLRARTKVKPGFTLVELLIAMLISGILVGLTTSVYSLFRKSLTADQNRADISQNARISIDRLTRDIRQSPEIMTTLPSSQSDTTVSQPGSLEMEDGHAGDLTYRYYYLSGTTMKLDIKEYYFAGSPTVRVRKDATSGGVGPVAHVISTTDVADRVQSLAFYGNEVILAVITTTDQAGQTYTLTSSVYRRN